MADHTIAIIGAGFSGTVLALHLQRRCPAGTRILLIERSGPFGPGLAYSTGNPNHLLNVPAGRMSAFDDRPRDFLDWLERQSAQVLDGVVPAEGAFVPRRLYGAYLRHLLNAGLLAQAANTLELVQDGVTAIKPNQDGVRLQLGSRRWIQADQIVLATGNPPPEPVRADDAAFHGSGLWRPDALSADAFSDLPGQSPVLLIGTGLTMVDAVISLLDQGHAGPIHALSRRGLAPRAHVAASGAKVEAQAYPTDIAQLTRLLRGQAATGQAWRPVIDALRPSTQVLWQTMPVQQKQRFLRHLRPWWDVHRHRMAPSVAARIEDARSRGQLVIGTGRIRGFDMAGHMVDVRFQPRGGAHAAVLRVGRVVNCTGPATDYARIADPLMRQLLSSGLVRQDELRLGLDVTGTCELRNRAGEVSRRLFAVGPVTRGAFWEITAVPDIRRQLATLAAHLAGLRVNAASRTRHRASDVRQAVAQPIGLHA